MEGLGDRAGGRTLPRGADLTSAMELLTDLSETINERRANPGPDILSQVLGRDDPSTTPR